MELFCGKLCHYIILRIVLVLLRPLCILLDNVKIGNLKRKNRDHKKVFKQDEDTGNLQILLHLRSLF